MSASRADGHLSGDDRHNYVNGRRRRRHHKDGDSLGSDSGERRKGGGGKERIRSDRKGSDRIGLEPAETKTTLIVAGALIHNTLIVESTQTRSPTLPCWPPHWPLGAPPAG